MQELLRHASLKVTTDVYNAGYWSSKARGAEQFGQVGEKRRGFKAIDEHAE